MAANAVIGALRIDLGINSAQFMNGLKSAQTGLGNFSKMAVKGLAVVSVAATAAGAALGVAIKGAIDHADALSKTSQKVGLSVEALSRLEYAAKLSDVSLEGLSTGLRRFSQSVVEAAGNGASRPGRMFEALGVAVKDAGGSLRSNEAIFADVAEQLSKLEDGALKTSLAVDLFGRSGGDLIPLLNGGAAGLAQMATESDRLGATIGTKTARSAELFNDTLTRVGQVLQGVVNKMMEAALPTFQSFADFLSSPEFAQAAETFGTTLLTVLNGVAQAIVGVTNAARDLFTYLSTRGQSAVAGLSADKIAKEIAATEEYLKNPNLNSTARNRSTNYLAQLREQQSNLSYMDPVGSGTTFGELSGFKQGTSSLTPPVFDFSGVTTGAKQATTAVVDLMAGVDDATPKVENFAETISNSLTSAFTGMVTSIVAGENALAALGNMLGNLGSQLLNSGLNMLFSNLFGGGFGGLFGGGAAGIRMPALYAKGGIANQPSIFAEAGPEAAVPLPDGRTIPVTLSGAGGDYLAVKVVSEVRNGNLVPVMTEVAGQVAGRKIKAEAPAAVAAAQRDRGM